MKLITYILIFFLFGCAAKKEHYKETTTYKTDTLVLKTETIKAPILTSSIVIEQLCDSLGNLRPFKQTLTRGRDTIYLTSENGGLRLDINLDSISKSAVDKFKRSDNFKELTEKESRVIVKQNWKMFFIALGGIVAFIIFPAIPKFLHSLVAKLFI